MMLKYFVIAILIFSSFSCQTQNAQKTDNSADNKIDSISNSIVNAKPSENVKSIVETFTDKSNIGVPRANKIELSEVTGAEHNVVEIKFYSLTKDKTWKLKQTFNRTKYGFLSSEMKLEDFNNDGFKDVTFVSDIAARGANEIRELLIYAKKDDQLVHIKNSGDYPNLLYSKDLDCIDSQAITGSSEITFLKIEGDRLKEFASVETSNTVNERRVYLIDKNGSKKLLQTDKISEDEIFERYKTFNPPTTYTAKELEQ